MKIVNNNNVYIQKEDLYFLSELNCDVPKYIIEKSQSDEIMNIENHFNFIKISDPETIDFINNTKIVIDYDSYKHLAYQEISGKLYRLSRKINTLISSVNNLKDEELHEAMIEYKILNHRFNSFKYLSDTLINRAEINLPIENNFCM